MYQTSGTLGHAKWIQMANPSEKHGGTREQRYYIHTDIDTDEQGFKTIQAHHIHKPWWIDLRERVSRQCALMRYSFDI